ncbi:alpha-L-fucosidase [Caldanaerobius polysaccharolyticus]|uniref:alpha-L-fucosidase n=1 Tax=Caldanaerobius polysaccharolyticus TaxID=44256 RepID=UPI000552AAAF|nr:alpha-L-fucosidase [Caldanaerobius polysaccharolyticus]
MTEDIKEKMMKKINDVISKGPFADTWQSLLNYRIPQWYEDGKFGIFIHWGVYSVPAFGNEWYPRNMYQQGTPEFEHHVKTYGPQSQFGYKDFIPMFKAEKFDPKAWADLFEKSGARYVVPVAEHHDGFQMYDSAVSIWNAANMGPKRDIIGELAAVVRERGLVFGLSNHRAEHWWFFDGGMKFDSDVRDPRYRDFYGPARPAPKDLGSVEESPPDEEFLEDWLLRVCELVDKYQPQIVWFDWWIQNLAFKPYLRKFAAYYYNRAVEWNKEVAINYKYNAYEEGTAVFDIERGQFSDIRQRFWQTDTSVSKNSWGYIENHDYKAPNEIICDLVDIVSKNGSLLLNIGPKSDGTIPEPEREILMEIGRWLKINGEAIYGTRPWKVFGEGPTKVTDGAFTDTKRSAFTSEDIRFTTKGDTLYAVVLKWPESGRVSIKSLGANSPFGTPHIDKVELIGCDVPLKWNRSDQALVIDIAGCEPKEYPVAFRIKIEIK